MTSTTRSATSLLCVHPAKNDVVLDVIKVLRIKCHVLTCSVFYQMRLEDIVTSFSIPDFILIFCDFLTSVLTTFEFNLMSYLKRYCKCELYTRKCVVCVYT